MGYVVVGGLNVIAVSRMDWAKASVIAIKTASLISPPPLPIPQHQQVELVPVDNNMVPNATSPEQECDPLVSRSEVLQRKSNDHTLRYLQNRL